MASRAPLVAIPTFQLLAGRVLGWERGAYAVPETYLGPLRRAGARPVLLPPTTVDSGEELLVPFSGLLLAGGGDVDPARYGADPHPDVYGTDSQRDGAEILLARAAMSMGVPTLAICRGLQVLNVACGGTLHQHLPELPGMRLHGHPITGQAVLHDVRIAGGSRLAEACGSEPLRCTSHHHQGIDRLAEELVPVAWSDDGLVEGVERAGPDGGWLVGVQWHPEITSAEDSRQQALFDSFVAHARAWGEVPVHH